MSHFFTLYCTYKKNTHDATRQLNKSHWDAFLADNDDIIGKAAKYQDADMPKVEEQERAVLVERERRRSLVENYTCLPWTWKFRFD